MVPTITAVSSILGFRRNESFQFQPAASNSPTSWAATGLPSGVTINTTTGLISGSVAVAGVWVFTLTATNGTGTSAAVQFVLGISPEAAPVSASSSSSAAVDLEIDVATREVRRTAVGTGSGAAGPLLFAKEGDAILLAIRFKKGDEVVDPACATLKFVAKMYEPEGVVATGSTFEKVGSGASAVYNLLVTFSLASLGAALSDSEGDAGTGFDALSELEWTQTVTHATVSTTLRASTKTFTSRLERDLADN